MNIDAWATAGSGKSQLKGLRMTKGNSNISCLYISKKVQWVNGADRSDEPVQPTASLRFTQVKQHPGKRPQKCLPRKMFCPQALNSASTYKNISCWQNFQLNLCEMEPMRVLEMGRQRGKYCIKYQAGELLCCRVHPVFIRTGIRRTNWSVWLLNLPWNWFAASWWTCTHGLCFGLD